MDIDPSSPPVVKEFRFNRASGIVTVVFGDDQSQDFKGSENYKKAHVAAANAAIVPSADLGLVDDKGDAVIMVVIQGTPHETFKD
jgi:hypothetical protein